MARLREARDEVSQKSEARGKAAEKWMENCNEFCGNAREAQEEASTKKKLCQ